MVPVTSDHVCWPTSGDGARQTVHINATNGVACELVPDVTQRDIIWLERALSTGLDAVLGCQTEQFRSANMENSSGKPAPFALGYQNSPD